MTFAESSWIDDDAVRAETVRAQATLPEVRQALRDDPKFLIDFFLHEQLVFPVPPLHVTIVLMMQDQTQPRMALAIPRDHAKTTLAKIVVVWYFLFSPYRFCVYLSNTSHIAKNACRDIMEFIRSDNCVSVFGPAELEKESETDGLWIFTLNGKRCILRSAGANQQMRGINVDNIRPEIAIVDDFEDKENTATPHLQMKLKEWFMGTFIKALAKAFKVIYIGNMVATQCLLKDLVDSPRWHSMLLGCLVRGDDGKLQPLWADRWPLQELMLDYRDYQRMGLTHIWMAEMMNRPTSGANGFDSRDFHYQVVPLPEDLRASFQTVDPAFKPRERNDNTGIAVHGIFDDRAPMVVDSWCGKCTEAVMFDHIVENALRWNAWTVGIESVAAQAVLITLFTMMAQSQGYFMFEFVPLLAGEQKVGRISAWVAMMEQENYGMPLGDISITEQLLNYDKLKKENDDDLIDACAYGPQMLENYLGIILANVLGPMIGDTNARNTYEVCDV